ncbi:MAG: signal peptidase [Acidobacteriota bacterium]|jgi:signal peptidase I|nr:signal peptidase [Acidobacteriota bacterium]
MRLLTLSVIFLITLSVGCAISTQDTVVFEGTSMEPSIHNGDRLRVRRFDRGGTREVMRGEVIWFLTPEDSSKYYIKRVIGLPNEIVEIRENSVFINGLKLEEPYIELKRNLSGINRPPLTIKEHQYYVLGDNRDASSDSRIWGLVPEELIVGKVFPK